jgi:hypothetical protein
MERVVLDAGKARDDISRPTPYAHVPFKGGVPRHRSSWNVSGCYIRRLCYEVDES